MLAALAAPAPTPSGPVTVSAPRPYEIWDGRVTGRAPAGTQAISVSAGPRTWTVVVGSDGRFDQRLGPVPVGPGDVTVAGKEVSPVWGVPAGSVTPLPPAEDDAALDARYTALSGQASPHVGIYSQAWNGDSAAFNAGAEFEAASTLKLPIMLLAMSHASDELEESPYWDPMTRVTRYSDNAWANELLEQVAGSDTGGAADMVELMRELGLTHTYMAGGYLTGYGGGPPVVTVTDPPPSAYKHTTPAEMATLARY